LFSGTFVYCQSCRFVNAEGKERWDRLRRQKLKAEAAKRKKEAEEKDAKIARLEAMNMELTQIVNSQEQRMGGHLLVENDMNNEAIDEILSQADKIPIRGNYSSVYLYVCMFYFVCKVTLLVEKTKTLQVTCIFQSFSIIIPNSPVT